jgi:hypothetical protein
MAKSTNAGDPETATGVADDSPAEMQSDAEQSGAASGSGIVDMAKQAASQAKDAASQAIDQAKDQATSRIDEHRQTAASGIQAVAQAFHSMGEDLRNRDQGPVAGYAAEIGHAMGGQVERLAKYLQQRDVHQLVTDAEEFARRSPAVFLGSAFVLGLAASRFLKSSRPAPDFVANMPDPNRALLPASTPLPSTAPMQPATNPVSEPPFWASELDTPAEGTGLSSVPPLRGGNKPAGA